MRYLVLLMMITGLMMTGCQPDEPASEDEAAETVEVEDDLTEVYDEAMAQAEQAEAEIAELIERGPEDSRDDAIRRVWERAQDLAAEARDQAQQAWEIAQDNGEEAIEARDSAERAQERADLAWEEASAFTGEAWSEARAAALELRSQADEAWARLREADIPESVEDETEDETGDEPEDN